MNDLILYNAVFSRPRHSVCQIEFPLINYCSIFSLIFTKTKNCHVETKYSDSLCDIMIQYCLSNTTKHNLKHPVAKFSNSMKEVIIQSPSRQHLKIA